MENISGRFGFGRRGLGADRLDSITDATIRQSLLHTFSVGGSGEEGVQLLQKLTRSGFSCEPDVLRLVSSEEYSKHRLRGGRRHQIGLCKLDTIMEVCDTSQTLEGVVRVLSRCFGRRFTDGMLAELALISRLVLLPGILKNIGFSSVLFPHEPIQYSEGGSRQMGVLCISAGAEVEVYQASHSNRLPQAVGPNGLVAGVAVLLS